MNATPYFSHADIQGIERKVSKDFHSMDVFFGKMEFRKKPEKSNVCFWNICNWFADNIHTCKVPSKMRLSYRCNPAQHLNIMYYSCTCHFLKDRYIYTHIKFLYSVTPAARLPPHVTLAA